MIGGFRSTLSVSVFLWAVGCRCNNIMIDSSKKRNSLVGAEVKRLYVIERRSNTLVSKVYRFKGTS